MAEHTNIEWATATWNPWYGCKEVSPGCAHCYARRDMERYGRDFDTVTRSKTKFTDPLTWKEPQVVFTCSWSDWFHPAADGWRDDAYEVIRATPWHTYLILTKRIERAAERLPWSAFGDPWENIWMGTSIENQRFVDRARRLATIAAARRFLSLEPLLGPVEATLNGIDWVIVGGESGPEARPMELDWARTLRDACQRQGIAFFLKQLGGHPDPRAHGKAVLDGKRWTERPTVTISGALPPTPEQP